MKKNFQKTLILAFEANSALSCQNGLFFRVLSHCAFGFPKLHFFQILACILIQISKNHFFSSKISFSFSVLCVIGLLGLWYFRPQRKDEDEVNLVHNMEIPHNTTAAPTSSSATRRSSSHISNNEEMNVHYVVPRPETQGTTEELSVYISTPNGLKKLERKHSDR